MHEPGASIQITNEFKPLKTIIITNRLQLFTNYIHNPQNIDIDWEMIAQIKLNWFTDLRFNTHFIFDDDTKTIVKNEDGSPVLGADGKPKETARVQFKELMGLSFVFRF
jgi:ABC-type anion transport system duplicated permease subunit